MTYRPEIDGLRAISILLILIYHVDPALVPGGFIGVDVFFVISGYLITRNITDDLALQRFSFADFYARRIRRIFPSVILVLGLCLVVGWWGLFAHEYAVLGKHIAASAGFVSNFVYQAEAGYFDLDSASKPLLHLWSLAVEEQFYLLWPLLIWLAHRLGRRAGTDPDRAVQKTILFALLGSLGLASVLNLTHPTAVFYFSPARAWELCAGALLVFVQPAHISPARRRLLGWLGLFLIAAAAGLLNHPITYPGFWVLIPVLGSALLILAGASGWAFGPVLASAPMVRLGLLSFSIYLWHWPVLYFIKTLGWSRLYPHAAWLSVPFILLLAWLSFVLVERPIRSLRSRWVAVLLAFLMALIGLLGLNVYVRKGLDFRERMTLENFGGLVEESDPACQKVFAEHGPKFCRIHDASARVDVLLLGDSIGHNAYHGIALSYARQGMNVAMIGWPGVPSLLVPQVPEPLYEGEIDKKLNRVLSNLQQWPDVKTVLLSHRLPHEVPAAVRGQLIPTLERIRASGKQVIFLLPPPLAAFNPIQCYGLPPLRPVVRSECAMPERDAGQTYLDERQNVRAQLMGAQVPFFDPHEQLCQAGTCMFAVNKRVIYRNVRYLTAEGSEIVYGGFLQRLHGAPDAPGSGVGRAVSPRVQMRGVGPADQ